MNVLVLCERIPSSYRDGLTLRVLHYVRRLNTRHAFDLICLRDGEMTPEVRAIFRSVKVFDKPVRKKERWPRSWSPEVLYPVNGQLMTYLSAEVVPSSYDVIWDAACCMAPHIPSLLQEIPYFADLVDEMVLTLWRRLLHCRSLNEAARLVKYLWLHGCYERRYLGRSALCSVVSDVDAKVLARVVGHNRIQTVQNGVDIEYFAPDTSEEDSRRIVFEGSMAFGPNIDAAIHLVRNILPRIRATVPDVVLDIVGRDPAPEVLALAAPGVNVTGSVEDVRPYVRRAAVFVCPLRFGAGIKNKVLQAWSMSKALVATTVSVDGLPAVHGANCYVQDDATAFADAVITLIVDPSQRRTLGSAGRHIVESRFSWDVKSLEFEAALERATQKRG